MACTITRNPIDLKIFITILLMNITLNSMAQYKVLTFDESIKYKKNIDIDSPLSEIEFNKARVYEVSKDKFLVMPNGIFSNHLLLNDLTLIADFSEKKYFPDGDEVEKLWYASKDADTTIPFKVYYEKLSGELAKIADNTTFQNPDSLYEILKKKRKQKIFSKHFLFLLGDYLMKATKNTNLKIALVQRYIYLNPIYSIVLIDTSNHSFYDYENDVYGKWGYFGTEFILKSIGRFTFKNPEMWNCKVVHIYE